MIRLNQTDFDRWRKTYHAIPDLVAELSSIDAWLSDQPEEKRKRWFHGAQGMLNRRHQEAVSSARQPASSGQQPRRAAVPDGFAEAMAVADASIARHGERKGPPPMLRLVS